MYPAEEKIYSYCSGKNILIDKEALVRSLNLSQTVNTDKENHIRDKYWPREKNVKSEYWLREKNYVLAFYMA